jgi:multiple sugar transport system ATP-binding protein
MYRSPANLFVAGFIGSPAMNLLEAEVAQNDRRLMVRFGSHSIHLDDDEMRRWSDSLARFVGGKIVLGVRPEKMGDALLSPAVPVDRRFHARAELVETLGAEVVVHLGVDASPVLTDDVRELARDVDAAAIEELERQREARRAVCVARFDPATRVQKGDVVDVAIGPGSLHFFDFGDGRAL